MSNSCKSGFRYYQTEILENIAEFLGGEIVISPIETCGKDFFVNKIVCHQAINSSSANGIVFWIRTDGGQTFVAKQPKIIVDEVAEAAAISSENLHTLQDAEEILGRKVDWDKEYINHCTLYKMLKRAGREKNVLKPLGFQKVRVKRGKVDLHIADLIFLEPCDESLENFAGEAFQNANWYLFIELMCSCLNAISSLASIKRVHCDLKGDNFMMCDDAVKMIDFGELIYPEIDANFETGDGVPSGNPDNWYFIKSDGATREFYTRTEQMLVAFLHIPVQIISENLDENLRFECSAERFYRDHENYIMEIYTWISNVLEFKNADIIIFFVRRLCLFVRDNVFEHKKSLFGGWLNNNRITLKYDGKWVKGADNFLDKMIKTIEHLESGVYESIRQADKNWADPVLG